MHCAKQQFGASWAVEGQCCSLRLKGGRESIVCLSLPLFTFITSGLLSKLEVRTSTHSTGHLTGRALPPKERIYIGARFFVRVTDRLAIIICLSLSCEFASSDNC